MAARSLAHIPLAAAARLSPRQKRGLFTVKDRDYVLRCTLNMAPLDTHLQSTSGRWNHRRVRKSPTGETETEALTEKGETVRRLGKVGYVTTRLPRSQLSVPTNTPRTFLDREKEICEFEANTFYKRKGFVEKVTLSEADCAWLELQCRALCEDALSLLLVIDSIAEAFKDISQLYPVSAKEKLSRDASCAQRALFALWTGRNAAHNSGYFFHTESEPTTQAATKVLHCAVSIAKGRRALTLTVRALPEPSKAVLLQMLVAAMWRGPSFRGDAPLSDLATHVALNLAHKNPLPHMATLANPDAPPFAEEGAFWSRILSAWAAQAADPATEHYAVAPFVHFNQCRARATPSTLKGRLCLVWMYLIADNIDSAQPLPIKQVFETTRSVVLRLLGEVVPNAPSATELLRLSLEVAVPRAV